MWNRLDSVDPAAYQGGGMDIFLSPEDLEVLTGRKRASSQIKWLQEHRWPHEVNALGRPVILTVTVMRMMGKPVEPKPREVEGPPLEILRQGVGPRKRKVEGSSLEILRQGTGPRKRDVEGSSLEILRQGVGPRKRDANGRFTSEW